MADKLPSRRRRAVVNPVSSGKASAMDARLKALTLALAVLVAVGWGAEAAQVTLDVGLGTPFLLGGKKQTTYLKMGLTGFPLEGVRRTPVNVAIVIDKSGSMSGQKIAKAREAAIMAVGKLNAEDIVSVVAYDSTVTVLVPATKALDRGPIEAAIRRLSAGGNTALFAGVSRGAAEVRKFLDRNRVNRVILLSDGLANVGPDSPAELGALGASLIKEGIAVTTIGLGGGYNEDLMTQLAQRSDGSHYFAEGATDLARIFKGEFGDVLSVVAQEVAIKIHCAPGIRPIRVPGREADIDGQTVLTTLNQLYSRQEKYVILEVEVPPTAAGRSRGVATITVSYANMATKTTDLLTSSVAVRFTEDPNAVAEKEDKKVMVAAVEMVATETNEKAVKLRDKGKVKEAEELLRQNVALLNEKAEQYDSARLKRYGLANAEDAANLDPANWGGQRKRMRDWQQANMMQRDLAPQLRDEK